MTNDIIFICVGDSISSKMLLKHGETVLQAYRFQKRIAYRLRYFLHLLHIDKGLVFRLNPEITNCETNTFVIDGSLVYEPVIAQLRHNFPDSTIKYMYPNIVADKASMNPEVLRKYGCQVYSWDTEDCKKYGLTYSRACYDKDFLPSEKLMIEYDLCFIGADKGRYRLIKKLRDYAQVHGLLFYSRVCPNKNFLSWIHTYYAKPIPYQEYLDITHRSCCIVDFVQKGQSGTTMRTMEAIFSGEKLVSNNPYLKQMDFYHPANIFIVENDSYDGLEDFLKKETVPINPDILRRYQYEEWRKSIM